MASQTLLIQHIPNVEPAQFRVVRARDGKMTPLAEIASPTDFPVVGRPGRGLVREVRWYLETFLDYPFPPETEHAERVQQALRDWGSQAFTALFGSREGGGMFDEATRSAAEELELRVSSDDPRILGWPWEALHDPQGGRLAPTCRIQRQLNQVPDPAPLSEKLPRDRINILLVTARPYESDVRFRSITRPIVSLIRDRNLPAHVTLLRPPTFDNLRRHLREHPHHYHILHFDGHGAYGNVSPTHSTHTLQGPQGQLVFEDEAGEEDPKTAAQLTELLREHRIPAVVLNACQSAMIDGQADDAFASVAAALLRSGIRSVVAMAYSLYVSAAQQFLPPFYERLFESGSFAEATRAGRQQLIAEPGRVCARGEFPLDDWLVPVLYEQEPLDLSFARTASRETPPDVTGLDEQLPENPYRLIGRDGAILALERAMHRPPAGLLVQGLGGIGKTTLAGGFAQWLIETRGLEPGRLFWFAFDEIRSAEFVINRLGEALFGTNFGAADSKQKMAALTQALRQHKFLIVWDNFEVARGIEGTTVEARLSDADQQLLRTLLSQLRGGQTKVLITSRGDEEWLGSTNRFEVSLSGLQGEERWDYCTALLRDLGLKVNRKDSDLVRLIDRLDGHPLAMRVILPQLEKKSAGALVQALESNLAGLSAGTDASEARLFATLAFAEESIPADLRPLLEPLSLHERFVDGDYLAAMAGRVDSEWTRPRIDRFLTILCVAGLLSDRGNAVYELHPLLSRFLRGSAVREPAEAWVRAFVDVLGRLADQVAPRQLHEQRGVFHLFGESFHAALAHAERLGMETEDLALTQSLAAYALNTRDFAGAAALFTRQAGFAQKSSKTDYEAGAYHQLGMVAEEQRDFAAADQWYRKSLAISEKQGNEHYAASSYHHLGRVAQEQRDFAAAEQWHRKSLAIKEKQGNEHGAATSYHALGMVAEEQRRFVAAEQWYRKSLAIKEKQGNEHGAATSYHTLGMVAQKQLDFVAAEQWYRKSLAIFEKQGNEHGAAISYHQLGMVAEDHGDFVAAEKWHRKALAIFEKQRNEHGAAISYHQLGIVALEQRDFAAAEQWYRKSLAIKEKQGNEHGAAISYHQLGRVAEEQRDFVAAEQWYHKALAIYEKQGNEHGAAGTYGQLGIVAGLQKRFVEAGQWLIKSAVAFARANDAAGAERNARNLVIFHESAPPAEQAQLKALWDQAGLGPWPGS